jgi:hypothetical protein
MPSNRSGPQCRVCRGAGPVLRRPAVVPCLLGLWSCDGGAGAGDPAGEFARVEPACLRRLGFEFMPGGLEGALRRLLG